MPPKKGLLHDVELLFGFPAVSLLMPLVRVEKVLGPWQVDGSQSRTWSGSPIKINLIKIVRLNFKPNQHQSGKGFLRLCIPDKSGSKTLPTKRFKHDVELLRGYLPVPCACITSIVEKKL